MESNSPPKIRIYCHNDRYFLVVGEDFLDEILTGRLPDDADLDIIDTKDYQKVLAEWESFNPGSTPWMIHPNIAMEYREKLREKTGDVLTAETPKLEDRRSARFKIRRHELPRRRS